MHRARLFRQCKVSAWPGPGLELFPDTGRSGSSCEFQGSHPRASAQNAETLCRRLMVSLVSLVRLTSLPGFCFHSLVCSNEPVGRALQPRLLPFHHLSLEFIDLFLFSNYLTCWKTLQGQSCESRAKSQAIDKLSKRPAAWLKITAMACAAAPLSQRILRSNNWHFCYSSACNPGTTWYNYNKLDKPILTPKHLKAKAPQTE